jgi:hypothetical protein
MKTKKIKSSLLCATLIAASVFSIDAAVAAPTGQQYATPEKAVDGFIGAVRTYDLNALSSVFGEEGAAIFVTDNPAADENERKRFLELYDSQHQLTKTKSGAMVLTVGSGQAAWPFPIPIVKTKKGWAFDTAAGSDEIFNRRIGRNELQTIQTCLAIVAAQYEYYTRDRDGDGIREYAQVIRSSPGLHDGLFWPAEAGEPQSPLGVLFAAAAAEGYKAENTGYHGYRYKILSRQGPAAADGAYDYVVRDNQIGGFAIYAYPASYGESGIMTFIVNHTGVIYEQDLGELSETEIGKLSTFNPTKDWVRVPDKYLAPIPEE